MYLDEQIIKMIKDNDISKYPVSIKELANEIAEALDDTMGGLHGNGWFEDNYLPNLIETSLEINSGSDSIVKAKSVIEDIDNELDIYEHCSYGNEEW